LDESKVFIEATPHQLATKRN